MRSKVLIKEISYEDTFDFHNLGKKDGLIFKEDISYIGYYENDILIGIAGYEEKNKKAILRCTYVLRDYRGKGIYGELVRYRLDILKSKGFNVVESTCTEKSLYYHLRRGAKIIKSYKKYTKIKYENL